MDFFCGLAFLIPMAVIILRWESLGLPAVALYRVLVLLPNPRGRCIFCCCFAAEQTGTVGVHISSSAHNLQILNTQAQAGSGHVFTLPVTK